MFIINFSFKIIGIIICYRFFDCFLTRKNIPHKRVFLLIILLSTISMTMNLLIIDNRVNLLISAITIFIISLLFTDKFSKKCLIGILYTIFSLLIEVFIWSFINYIFDLDQFIIEEYNFFVYFGLILFHLVRFVSIWILKKHRTQKLYLEDKFIAINIFIIPLFSIIILFVFVNQEIKNVIARGYEFSYFFLFSIAIINIFIFHILDQTEKLYKEKIEYATKVEKGKYRELYYDELEKQQQQLKIIKHDLKNQLLTISSYISDKEYEKALDVLKLLAVDINSSEKHIFTKNITINSILNCKLPDFAKYKINYEFKINVPAELKISDKDIVFLTS